MRDLRLLRRRLHTALTSGLLLAACGPAPTPAPVEAAKAAPAKAATPEPAPAKVEAAPVVAAPPAPAGPQYPARTGMDPFDPDGLEEEGCTNGDWCGSPAAANKFRAPQATDEIGCPTRLIGRPDPGVSPNDKTYKGLSMNPMMMGRLRKIATGDKRKATGDGEICCYHWFDYCSGRPLLTAGDDAVAAPVVSGSTWLGDQVPEDMLGEPGADERPLLAAAWLEDAQMEHASVAAFARAALELMAVGAPPELLAGCAEAGLDEVRHAQVCFALAAAYGGVALGPGPLPPVQPRAGGLVALACDTFREGCVGETLAALTALRGRRGCAAPAADAALAAIAADETRHAELAWATVAWAIDVGGVEVAEAVRAVAAELRAAAFVDEPPAARADLRRFGRLGPQERAAARRDAWTGVLDRMLALVLGDEDEFIEPPGRAEAARADAHASA
ncbi:hypothetical protein SAMN02745121_01477 [Nannocystis exedens]|uniref:Ferritin-like domain-containing protein n=1 Tax=Nannocystis exedens TaxID=54 RepID=A0A1I1V8R0_9BACT|nr:hypothetical protein [Nannocystis exedens]PCC72275.1 hypothetical protein NAEX_05354 [Nannocystis exedens]SFD76790.1 hypothetical protein SAMN02745121_01477 [Nannocystis exedens]